MLGKEGVVAQLLMSRAAAALFRWRRAAARVRRATQRARFCRHQGARRLALALRGWVYARLGETWVSWRGVTVALRRIAVAERELAAARRLQNKWRSRQAAIYMDMLREAQRKRAQDKAARFMQRHERGRKGRARAVARRRWRAERRAALMLITLMRVMLARRARKRLGAARNRGNAARLIQRVIARGCKGRAIAAKLRHERRERLSAVMVQSNFRGRRGREEAKRRKIFVYQSGIAIMVQKHVRAVLCRKKFRIIVAGARKRRVVEITNSITIQRVYRGHRGRVQSRMKGRQIKAREKRKDRQVIMIQKIVRGFVARKVVGRRLNSRRESMLRDARAWVEKENEETGELFYENVETGEKQDEPPETGYTRLDDNKLVLADGLAVVDPLEELTPEERHEREMATKCCLCEQKEATRKCGPCGDQFCTDCFLSSHAHGARQKHAWERIGRPICESCVKNFAFRWCVQCDEPLCAECWGIIHYTKDSLAAAEAHRVQSSLPDGSKKRFTGHVSSRDPAHAFFAIGARNGRVAETSEEEVFGAGDDDDEEKDATPEDGWIPLQDDQGVTYYYNRESGSSTYDDPRAEGFVDPAVAKAAAAAAIAATFGDWTQYDDGEGKHYWFNSRTGESTYDDPPGYKPHKRHGS